MKRKYTVKQPPRVHELARLLHLSSDVTINYLYLYNSEIYRTPSHKVPLRVSLGFLTWMRTQ